MSVCTYGTVEFRRHHGTLQPEALCCWAAFCVGFVDCFASHAAAADEVLDVPLDDGLAALQRAQETATLRELAALMARHVEPGVFERLARAADGRADA